MAFLTDSSLHNFTVTAFGGVSSESVIRKFGGGSAYFDGNGDYLTAPADEAFDYGSGNFTLEFWVYPLSGPQSAYNPCFFTQHHQNDWNETGKGIRVHHGNAIFGTGAGTFVQINFTNPIQNNVWTHVAIVKNGNTITSYLNGGNSGSIGHSSNLGDITDMVGIGLSDTLVPGGREFFYGYLDDLRITKGVARYVANFTPPSAEYPNPTSPVDLYGVNVSLLLHADGSEDSTNFIDSSLNNLSIAVHNNARIKTTTKKFGSGAAYFDGNGDYLSVANSPLFNFGTGDFTVEAWIYRLSDVRGGIFGMPQGGISIVVQNDGTLFADKANVGGSPLAGSTFLPTNTWHHIAVTRQGGYARTFVNGVIEAEAVWAATLDSSQNAQIGDVDSGQWPFNGYIDDLRVTKGVARYTANFVPPALAFPNPSHVPLNGLSLWLKADSGVTYDGGNNVSSWEDQSGTGNHASSSGGNRPLYLSSGLNGRPALSFDGIGQLMTIADNASLNTDKLSIYLVMQRSGDGNGNDVIFMKNGNPNLPNYPNQGIYGLTLFNGSWAAAAKRDNAYFYDFYSSFSVADSSPHLIGYRFGPSFWRAHQDSQENATNGGSLPLSSGTLQIGGYNQSFGNSSGEWFNGKISEFIVYNRYVTDQEHQQITNYLRAKYALYSMPTGGLQLWLKADSGVTVSGSFVEGWADQSGNGNSASGDVESETAPALVSNSLNGNPGIQFNGNQILLTNNFYPVNWDTPITMIGVARASASTVKGGHQTARWFETVSDQYDFDTGLIFGPYNGTPAFGSLVGISYSGESDLLNSNMGEDEKGLAVMVNDGTTSKYYHNGTLKGTYTFGWNTGGTTPGSFAIGATRIGNLALTGFQSTSTIYELAIYNRAITDQERQQIEAYLNAKYAIY